VASGLYVLVLTTQFNGPLRVAFQDDKGWNALKPHLGKLLFMTLKARGLSSKGKP
jgi:hypothetical protein